MRPYIKNGAPIGKDYCGALPRNLSHCLCWECYDHTTSDPVTGCTVRGRYLGKKEHAAHRAAENARGIAPAAHSQAPLPPATNHAPQGSGYLGPHFNSLELLSPLAHPLNEFPLPQCRSIVDEEKPKGSSLSGVLRHLQLLSGQIAACKADYLHKRDQRPLVFCMSPTLSSSIPGSAVNAPLQFNTGPLSLSYSAQANSCTLGYEEWLYNSLNTAQSAILHSDVHVRLKVKVLQTTVTKEMLSLYEAKRNEWLRQHAILSRQYRQRAPVTIQTG